MRLVKAAGQSASLKPPSILLTAFLILNVPRLISLLHRLLLTTICLIAVSSSASAGVVTVRIGILAYQGAERAGRDFYPTINYLNRSLPGYQFAALPMNQAALNKAIHEQAIDFVITNPGHYVDLESARSVIQLATLATAELGIPTDTVGSTVITLNRPGHPENFHGLLHKRIAVVSQDAFGGWRVVWREAKQTGADLHQDAQLIETGFPMQSVIEAVRSGRADAGVLRTCLLEEEIAAARIRPDEFTVISERQQGDFPCRLSSRRYPDWPFAHLPHTSSALAKAVAASLLTMPAESGRNWTVPQDYSEVHDLYRELKIGPYAYLTHTSISGFIRGHWQWFAVIALFLFWWVLHVVRVETLVRRRTAELTNAIKGREEAERSARKHREERDQFSRLGILGEMASNIAHELNQPLTAIANYAEGITRVIDAGRLNPSFIRDGARGIAGQAERAGAIIRRIRSFVRRREVKSEKLDMNDIMRGTLNLFEGQARLHGVPIHLRLQDPLPRIVADQLEIEQVLLNLLQNALDALEDSPRKTAGIMVSTCHAGDMVEVAVRDHGTGLSAEAGAKLFEPFFTTKPQGLGLGLSICRTIIESLGGHLWASPEAGGGTTMRFTLPISEKHSP